MLIWWLTGRECAAVMASQNHGHMQKLPEYMQRALQRRHAVTARGDLFYDPDEFDGPAVIQRWPSIHIPLIGYLKQNCGGIPIHKGDIDFLWQMPGIVTDFKLIRHS